MQSHSLIAMPPVPYSRLLDLPAELKLQIFAGLPAREIAHLRRLCREVHDFVDANAQHLSSEIGKRELVRLDEFIQYNIYYKDDVNFVHALIRWKQHKTWPGPNSCTRTFASHWVKSKIYAEFTLKTHMVLGEASDHAWDLIVDHLEDGSDWARAPYDFADRMSAYTQDPLCCISQNECRTVFLALKRTTSEEISSLHMLDCCHPEDATRKYMATLIRGVKGKHLSWDLIARIAPAELSAQFEAPRLPWDNLFGYYVEAEWAMRLIQEACGSINPVAPLKKAAVLEELRIY